jgi:hypothetical protein
VSAHRYPAYVLVHDGARCSFALGLSVAPLALLDTAPVVTALFACLATIFALVGLRDVAVHLQRFRLGEDGIIADGPADGSRRRHLRWSELQRVTLAFYSTRHDRDSGWFELKLAARAWPTIRMDSRIEGFGVVAAHVAGAIRCHHLAPDPATVHNFRALGIPIDPPDAATAARARR